MSEEFNKTAERDALVLLTQAEADDPVSAMKDLARIMQQDHDRTGFDSKLQYYEGAEGLM